MTSVYHFQDSHYGNTYENNLGFFPIMFLGGIFITEFYLLGKVFYEKFVKNTKEEEEEEDTGYYSDLISKITNNDKEIIVVRGAPGSGKRFFAEDYIQTNKESSYEICDLNDFFIVNDKYIFNGKELTKAEHLRNLNMLKGINNGVKKIFVLGHFPEKWMYQSYYEIAKISNYKFTVISLLCKDKNMLRELNKRSEHKIPYSKSLKVYETWEDDIKCFKSCVLSPICNHTYKSYDIFAYQEEDESEEEESSENELLEKNECLIESDEEEVLNK